MGDFVETIVIFKYAVNFRESLEPRNLQKLLVVLTGNRMTREYFRIIGPYHLFEILNSHHKAKHASVAER